jgi:glycosyltransferase involved in cell wall biosynthesis
MQRLDIVIPVYSEGRNLRATLAALKQRMRTLVHVLICYDRPDEDTLATIKASPAAVEGLTIDYVFNRSRGAHGAIVSGFAASRALRHGLEGQSGFKIVSWLLGYLRWYAFNITFLQQPANSVKLRSA